MLPGMKVYDIKKNPDQRGFFAELLRSDWKNFLEEDKIVQISLSKSKPGIIRAWHRHMEAVKEFLKKRKDFEVDYAREKFLLTFHPKGFLKRIK